MASKFSHILICFFFFSIQLFISHSRTFKPLNFLKKMEEVQKGQTVIGISEVKKYLHRLGYYPNLSNNNNLNDHFDDLLELALKSYQNYFNLEITGKLDSATKKKMMVPRCGMPDIFNITSFSQQLFSNKSNNYSVSYVFPPGNPKWYRYGLTFKLSNTVPGNNFWLPLSLAFETWSKVSKFTFMHVRESDKANIVINFYRGAHGDEYPFDGPGGFTAHSFYPENGNSHFDLDEPWNPFTPNSDEMDLQSVALHEYGHILGLAHSQDPNSVMYPDLDNGVIKRDLTKDDIDGLRVLYPN